MKVAIHVIPELGRPLEVQQAITEALALRDRAREQAEVAAAAQRAVDEIEREDVESAAARARAGEPLGTLAGAVTKAKQRLEVAQRDQAAIRLAQAQAEADVAGAIVATAEGWRAELDAEVERAREDGRAAIAALRDACERISGALAIRGWIGDGLDAGGFDRPPIGVMTGSFAPSSRRRTANAEPIMLDELLAYVSELVEPPASAPARPVLGLPAA
jgi:hypothetical protein